MLERISPVLYLTYWNAISHIGAHMLGVFLPYCSSHSRTIFSHIATHSFPLNISHVRNAFLSHISLSSTFTPICCKHQWYPYKKCAFLRKQACFLIPFLSRCIHVFHFILLKCITGHDQSEWILFQRSL